MPTLDVPYYRQEFTDACGLAAFHMVYKYLRPSKLSAFKQNPKTFVKASEVDTTSQKKRRITGETLVAYAQQRGFESGWGRVDPDLSLMRQQLGHFIENLKLPLIACQKYTDAEPLLGHYRVVLGINGDEVIFHDPDRNTGGEALRWNVDKFAQHWKYTGLNVTGGVGIWVSDRPIESGLGPGGTNPWPLFV